MGDGYGSECHLLRFMGRHRGMLDRRVTEAVGATAVEWLDTPFDPSKDWLDGEWKGIDFLRHEQAVQEAWRRVWPSVGNPPNWDAVGRVLVEGSWEWLLVEAKANVEELASSCQAKEIGGRPLITGTLDRVKRSLGVEPARDWLNGHYQYCNRVAVLSFLQEQGAPARLLFVYFTGDRGGPRRTCPADRQSWSSALRAQAEHVGLPAGHRLEARIHQLFLEVVPRDVGRASATAPASADAAVRAFTPA